MSIITKFFRAISKPNQYDIKIAVDEWNEVMKIIHLVRDVSNEFALDSYRQHKEKTDSFLGEDDIRIISFAVFIEWWSDLVMNHEQMIMFGCLSYCNGKLDKDQLALNNTALTLIKKNKQIQHMELVKFAIIRSLEKNNPNQLSTLKKIVLNAQQMLADEQKNILQSYTEKVRGLYLRNLFRKKYHITYYYDIALEMAQAA
ncbi:MAG: hypothetical protein KDD37_11695 [Bdellovibrionales bacterium]|nr:hypothetical protein [Bdellovibrionales bacterium]